MCEGYEDKPLTDKQRVMCDYVDDMQREECHVNERVNCCCCLLTKWSCVLENQNTLSRTAIINDMVRIGDYELLETRNEGYEQESTQLGLESSLTSIKHVIGILRRLY